MKTQIIKKALNYVSGFGSTLGIVAERNFRGKVVAVTGGASGIGLEICRVFGKQGASVAILDMNGQGAETEAQYLKNRGIDAIGLRCDVSDKHQCGDALSQVIETFGGVDVLVNNAGITQRDAFENTDIESLRKVMEVNFFGTVNCTKAVFESLIERKGMIIVTSSVAGLVPLLGRSSYCASKHALHGLYNTLRAELREKGVHVMLVCPSFVKTNLQTRALGGDGEVTDHPQSTVGNVDTPEQVAQTIFDGAVREKPMLVLSPIGKLSHSMNFLVPTVYERMMTNKIKKELDR